MLKIAFDVDHLDVESGFDVDNFYVGGFYVEPFDVENTLMSILLMLKL